LYRSPNSSAENNEKLRKAIVEICTTTTASHILITGDFNTPELEWSDCTPTPDSGSQATKLMECIRDSYLYQHVSEPTHFRPNTNPNILDLVLPNEASMVPCIQMCPPLGKSHHVTLLFDFHCYTKETSTIQEKYMYDKGDYDRLREITKKYDWETLLANKSLDEAWQSFTTKLIEFVNTSIPKTTRGTKARGKVR